MKKSKTGKTGVLSFLALLLIPLLLMTSCDLSSSSGLQGILYRIQALFGNEDAERNLFANEIGGTSETFTGALSETTFQTAAEAAEAFILTEKIGEMKMASITIGEPVVMSVREINALGIPEDLLTNAESVERLEVAYTIAADEPTTKSSTQDGVATLAEKKVTERKTVTVYVIKVENDFRYYTPAPVTGDTISKTYYDSVFDYNKFKNCTYKNTFTATLKMRVADENGNGVSFKAKADITQLIYYADGCILMEHSQKIKFLGQSLSEESISLYLETDGDITRCYYKDGKDAAWVETNLVSVGFHSLEELTPFYDQYLDYTYFTKTDYGFRLAGENAEQYIRETLRQEGIDFADLGSMGITGADMYAEYYVSGGVLSGMRQKITEDLDITYDGYKIESVEIESVATCKDYGKTVITRPILN